LARQTADTSLKEAIEKTTKKLNLVQRWVFGKTDMFFYFPLYVLVRVDPVVYDNFKKQTVPIVAHFELFQSKTEKRPSGSYKTKVLFDGISFKYPGDAKKLLNKPTRSVKGNMESEESL
jgi:hypothetical protein